MCKHIHILRYVYITYTCIYILSIMIEHTSFFFIGWSGAELAELCREAAMVALREDMHVVHVSKCHFDVARDSGIRRGRNAA